jgi:hypothetical protein
MASKVKGSARALQDKMLSSEGFTDICDNNGNLKLRYKTIEHENIFKDENNKLHNLQENIIVSYSPKRAKKRHI